MSLLRIRLECFKEATHLQGIKTEHIFIVFGFVLPLALGQYL